MRVAVTTSAATAPRVAGLLTERGLVPVVLPCIRIEPAPPEEVERARLVARDAEWIVVTSARAVRAVWPHGGMPPVPVAAVGPLTATAVVEAGGDVRVVGDAEGRVLVDALGDQVTGRRVVVPHARHAESTVEGLRRAGAEVVAVPVYETVPIAPDPAPVAAALFASPSAVAGWSSARPMGGIVVAAIGATTAGAARDAGAEAVVVPDRPELGAAIEALADAVRERSTP